MLRYIPQHCPQTGSFYKHLPAYEDGTECSETSANKFQTPGIHPKESIQHSVHGESLKSRCIIFTASSRNRPKNEFGMTSSRNILRAVEPLS